MRYNNYHKHTHYSNIITLDVVSKPIDYIKRAKELGHTTYFTTEHGWGGNVWEAYTLCNEYNLKMIYGAEVYYVDNRFEKNRTNYHLILIALNDKGFKDINRIISEANKTGYYYKPRIDLELLLSVDPHNIIVTTACIASRLFKSDDYEEKFLKPVLNYFKNNLYLEVQSHNEKIQIEYNKKILKLSEKYNIKMIHANDSHYIQELDHKYRDMFLKAKGIFYEDESNFILDYPDGEEIIDRYKKQGIFSDNQIEEILNNTLVFDQCQDIKLNKNIKLPKVSNDSNKELKQIIQKQWNKEKIHIPKENWNKYRKAIREEMDIIEKTNMEDYFLLDYKIVKKAKEKYNGVLTRTGRGCFTEDALVHTKNGLKSIKEIVPGDYVVTKDGQFNKVIKTMSYDIEEKMIKINHLYGTNKYNPAICTLDHKIYVKRDNSLTWIEAQELKNTDYVCVPKINLQERMDTYIDLNKYNCFGYKYDDEYIYEIQGGGVNYPFNPSEIARKIGVGKSIIEDFVKEDCNKNLFHRKKEKLKELMEYIPFDTREEYIKYVKEQRIKKIKRFINIDKEFNIFIGLLYGDGFTIDKRKTGMPNGVGLAINNSTEKDKFNRNVFYNIAKILNLSVTENRSKTKKLSQLYMYSKVLGNFIKQELFYSDKTKQKYFNDKWFYQDKENLLGIIQGLRMSDGSYEKGRINFDNTSNSLINAYKLLCLMTGEGVNSINMRNAWKTKEGYNCKKSYKLRLNKNSNNMHKKELRTLEDDKYYYLPITQITILPKQRNRVYDIEVENEHNYLLNNMIVHNSAPSFIINKLLEFTDIDRLDSPVTLYPTRFMSPTRILKTKSLPDIDLNWTSQEPPIKASKDILGEDGVYSMIAYKPLQDSSAFRLWCKAKGLHIDEYNEVAKNIEDYKENEQWKDLIEESKVFRGVIESIAPSPCAFLLYDKPISQDIGLIKIKNEICCCLDGYNCDVYKYLKNDYLIVTVWDIIDKVCKLVGIPIPTIKELNKLIDDKTWDMYAKGLTATLNQADKDHSAPLIKKYAPKTIGEICAWVASIRPGFASLLDNFLERKPYTTNVKELDNLLEDSFHYLMYQESIMKYLVWLGIEESETYGIIKKISKKKFTNKELEELKGKLKCGWMKKVGNMDDFEDTWKVIEDAARYSFNASHSLSVGYDNLYGAYLKSHYPLEYYMVVLNVYMDNVEKTAKIIDELPYFNIKIKPPKFRYSRGEYFLDKSTNSIYKGIASIKYLNEQVANELYDLRNNKYQTFIDLLIDIYNKTSCDSRKLDILIKLDYFSEFGKSKKLLEAVELFNNFYNKKQFKKDKLNVPIDIIRNFSNKETEKIFKEVDTLGLINYLYSNIENRDITLKEKIETQIEMLGSCNIINENFSKEYIVVLDINTKYTPVIEGYRLNDGKSAKIKISKKAFRESPIKKYDIVKMIQTTIKNKRKKVEDKWVVTDEKELWLNLYSFVKE